MADQGPIEMTMEQAFDWLTRVEFYILETRQDWKDVVTEYLDRRAAIEIIYMGKTYLVAMATPDEKTAFAKAYVVRQSRHLFMKSWPKPQTGMVQ